MQNSHDDEGENGEENQAMTGHDHLDESTLNDYVDGELAPLAESAVEAHLASCPPCRARVADLQRVFVALDNFPDVQPSRDLAASTIALLQARLAAQGEGTPSVPALRPVPTFAWAILTAQGVMAMVIGGWLWLQGTNAHLAVLWQWQGAATMWLPTLLNMWGALGQWGWQLPTLPQPWLTLPVDAVPTFPQPDLSQTVWLALLTAVALLWLVATRWLLALPANRVAAQGLSPTGVANQEKNQAGDIP
jgi:hypothetical protein